MKILVVGPYAPPPSPSASRTVETVRTLSNEGHEVEVLSPAPSAAHHDAHLSGPLGLAALRRLAPSFDGIVVRLEPGLFLSAHSGRFRWLAEAGMLAAGLRRWSHVTLEIDSLGWFPLGGRAAVQLWAAAERIVVSTADDRRRLEVEGGVTPARVVVRAPARPDRGGVVGWDDVSAATAEDVMAEIRVRAAVDRRLAQAESAGVAPPDVPPVERGAVAWAALTARRVLGPYADVAFIPAKRVRKLVTGR